MAADRYLEIEQEGSFVNLDCSDAEFIVFWVRYFDLDADYQNYIDAVNPRDKYLNKAVQAGDGIRILRQDLWEMIVSFLISQQNNIVRIRRCIDNICRRYGERKISANGTEFYAFPTPEQLAQATEAELKECNLGYRAKYVLRAAKAVAEGTIDLQKIEEMSYKQARQELLTIYGIGEKVADCICLFALHHLDAFPVDTHIRQALDAHYKRGFPNRRYKGIRGIIQQYIFYYELKGA
jgi:N-glycosylase/DNA lyase